MSHAASRQQNMNTAGMVLLAAAAGALTALLLAPKRGSEMRDDIKHRIGDMKGKTQDVADKARSAVNRSADKVSDKTDEAASSTKSAADNAADAAKAAAEDTAAETRRRTNRT